MKFVQLIEFHVRNIILDNSQTKCDGEAGARPCYERSKLSISLDQEPEML